MDPRVKIALDKYRQVLNLKRHLQSAERELVLAEQLVPTEFIELYMVHKREIDNRAV